MRRRPAFRYPKQKCVKRLVPKTRRGTIVGAIRRKSTILLIACPPGKMGPEGKCRAGTRAVESIKPARGGKCPPGYKRG